MSLKFQLVSDLHLETQSTVYPSSPTDPIRRYLNGYSHFSLPVCAPTLLLLGDIGSVSRSDSAPLEEWIRSLLRERGWERVLMIAGNHEFYGNTIEGGLQWLKKLEARLNTEKEVKGEFRFLNNEGYKIGDTMILGTTLWSDIQEDQKDLIQRHFPDFKGIEGFDLETYATLHREAKNWLSSAISTYTQDQSISNIIVITHHAPTFLKSSRPEFKDSPVTSAFASELLKPDDENWQENVFRNEKIKVWGFGHTHCKADFRLPGGLRVVANQRGYEAERLILGFDEKFVVQAGEGEN